MKKKSKIVFNLLSSGNVVKFKISFRLFLNFYNFCAMKDNYVNNIEEILIANQTQKNKIQFLERERIKRDHYLDDLKENLGLNKSTLRQMNDTGPNLQAMDSLIKQTDHLSQKLKEYYEEYQGINAVLLM